MSQEWKIKDGKKIGFVLEYSVPIDITEGDGKDFTIIGTAIDASISRNNVRYLPEELEFSCSTLKGVPILDSHKQESVKNILGIVEDAYFDKATNAVRFKGKIMDEEAIKMIADGRIRNVSIGAKVNDLPKDRNSDTVTAKGIEFLELSLVPVQGVRNATIDQALFEKYEFLNKSEEATGLENGENMTDNIVEKVETPTTAPIVEAKKEEVKETVTVVETVKENTEMNALVEKLKSQDEKLCTLEKSIATLIEKLNKEEAKPIVEAKPVEVKEEVKVEVKEAVKAEPKTVVESIVAEKKDDLIRERYKDGVSLWRMPSNPRN